MQSDHPTTQTVIDRVREQIASGGVTKAELARLAALHPNTLRSVEQFDWRPTTNTLIALEGVLFPQAAA